MTSHRPPALRATRRDVLRLSLPGLLLVSGCNAGSNGDANASAAVSPAAAAAPPGALERAFQEATRHFTDKCSQLWGTENTLLPSRKAWVAYDADWLSRGNIDFGRGEFTAQALVDADKADDVAPAIALIRTHVTDALTDTPADFADDDDVTKLARQLAVQGGVTMTPPPQTGAKGQPVLAGILPDDAAAGVSPDTLTRQPIIGDDGKPRIMLTYKVPFQAGYYAKLSARYVEAVRQEGGRYNLQPSLIFGVIETESAYNPRARSDVPAYGLMQIVPQSAGRDAYMFAYGGDRELDPEYLYDAGNNIRLGVAYLKLLDSRYFRDIENADSRRYATIAAYNTGAGNVARAFDGTIHVANAARLINQMSPDAVLRRLQAQLPYQETRNYITLVLARQQQYRAMDAVAAQADSGTQ
jgi:membrane-bound lytic murein transglycosylase C